MNYVDKNLLPDERVIFRTKKHLIIFFIPVLWTILSLFAAGYLRSSPILLKLEWIPWMLALILWFHFGLDYWTSEFIVTSKRLILREGFFYRHATELRLSAIAQVNVAQSLTGQIFNYGTISINAFGAYDLFTLLSRPYLFQNAVNQAIDNISR